MLRTSLALYTWDVCSFSSNAFYEMSSSIFAYMSIRGLGLALWSFGVLAAQEGRWRVRFPVWTFHQDSVIIYGLALGVIPNLDTLYTRTHGIRIEVLGVGLLMAVANLGILMASSREEWESKRGQTHETINGLHFSTTGSLCRCRMNGIAAGGFFQYHTEVNGFSGSLAGNLAQTVNGVMISGNNAAFMFRGVQLAGWSNEAYLLYGVQTAVALNEVRIVAGLQIGGVNMADTLAGAQIGLFNGQATGKGVQIGLVNFTREMRGLQIGLLNLRGRRVRPLIQWSLGRRS